MTPPTFPVTVIVATPTGTDQRIVDVSPGATLVQVLRLSGLPTPIQGDPDLCKAGIFGKIKPLDTVIRPGDRIEVYRPLTVDPKDARRRRVAKRRQLQTGP